MNRVNIFGSNVDKVSMAETLQRADWSIQSKTPLRIVVTNVAKIVACRGNRKLGEIINSADLIGADGVPLVWVSKLMGQPLPGRVNGTDLMIHLLELSSERNYRIFFLGATQEIVESVVKKAKVDYPGIQVAGWRNGYFTAEEEKEVVEEIRKSNADILFLGIPTPRKEEFSQKYFRQLNVSVCHGVGGSFDVFAGTTKRAPVWMQNNGLEWFYRLSQEPGRLWKRYLITNSIFLFLTINAVCSRMNKYVVGSLSKVLFFVRSSS